MLCIAMLPRVLLREISGGASIPIKSNRNMLLFNNDKNATSAFNCSCNYRSVIVV